ncbi:hypothetical protein [Streptomyces sp. NPDC005955]|jgi:hypothetical protein|uniref:hypothetical protein n=1 Tax=Streptomyces sp. NPDC005955 TaxID=3364738 RepID=UPI00368EDA76
MADDGRANGPTAPGVNLPLWAATLVGAAAMAVGIAGFYHLGVEHDSRGRGVNIADGPGKGWYTFAALVGLCWLAAITHTVLRFLEGKQADRDLLVPLVVTTPLGAGVGAGLLLSLGQEQRHGEGARNLVIGGIALPLLLWSWDRAVRRRRSRRGA